jgi:hypothetical protein
VAERPLNIRLATAASRLDAIGRHSEADAVDNVLFRLSQYAGPWHLNVPMQGRMQPYKEHQTELDDLERERQHHPRLRPTEMVDDGDTPEDKGLDDPDKVKQPKPKVNPDDEDTIFGLHDEDPEKGGDIFRMHDQGTLGFGFVTHDSQSAGMVGTERFEMDKRDQLRNPADRYKLLMPQM